MRIFQISLQALLCTAPFLLCAKEKVLDINAKSSSMVAAEPADESWKKEVSDIDKEIDKLVNQRNLYLAKATRLQNQGDRLQFENDDNLIDARRAWQQAQIHREIATRIQEEIDILEQRKQAILEAHGVRPAAKQ